MSQMWVEGTLGIVPELAPKIMLNEEGENITLSNNLGMFSKWADIWERENPFKVSCVHVSYGSIRRMCFPTIVDMSYTHLTS